MSEARTLATEGGAAPESFTHFAEDPKWDEGHNEGLVKSRPAYYVESGKLIVLSKAVAYAFIAIAPYFTILDQLGHNKEFVPCNNVTCHYTRIFNSKNIPATGVNVMAVRNGYARPIALHYNTFDAYACAQSDETRPYSQMIWGEEAASCPPVGHKDYHSFLDRHDRTARKVEHETDFTRKYSMHVKLAFYVTKVPLWLFAYPMNLIAKSNKRWGMEHLPNSRCPGMKQEDMRNVCAAKAQLAMKDTTIIENHLAAMSPSALAVYAGLGGYALLTALHDILVVLKFKEEVTLTLGFCATAGYGLAAVSMFFWAMGAAEVFVSPASDKGFDECACFFQIPEISALVALGTPFALFASFMARVQMQGLAAMYGDYLSFQTYYIPHYLARHSFLWTWGVLCSPKLAGTIQGEQRGIKKEHVSSWNWLYRQQKALFMLTVFLQMVVALSASSFMVAFKELCTSLYMRGDMTPMVMGVIKYVLLPGPSVVVFFVGLWALYDLYSMTIAIDKDETFLDQVITVTPGGSSCFGSCNARPVGGVRPPVDKVAGLVAFAIVGSLVLIWTVAAAVGLSPDTGFLIGNEALTHPKLAQAELWGACGFIFFFVHTPTLMRVAFSTWSDLESLKLLGKENKEGYGLLTPAA